MCTTHKLPLIACVAPDVASFRFPSDCHIRSIRCCGYYSFHHAILCGFYPRVATFREWRLLNSVILVKIFCKCKGFEKSRFYKIKTELRCSDLVLKQNFQLLDQPLLSYKAVPIWHLQSVSSFSSSNDFTRWSPFMPQKMPNLLDSSQETWPIISTPLFTHTHTLPCLPLQWIPSSRNQTSLQMLKRTKMSWRRTNLF